MNDPITTTDRPGGAVTGTPTLGGAVPAEYPALARDPEGDGFWSRVDRWTERAARWLNPILVKEARQSLQSKQFLITYFCLLAASCAWTVIGVVFSAPDVYYLPTGETLMIGYFLILSVSLFAFVPVVAFRSLAAELDEGTYEMLAITRLSAWRIVAGKMNSAILQMLIYFSAIVPCLAFCYLLRGIGLLTIVLCVAIALVVALVLTSFGLMLSTLAKGRTLQTFLLVLFVGIIVVAEITCCTVVFGAMISENWSGTWFAFVGSFTLATGFVVLFVAAAAARIAPVTENRSTRLRAILFALQVNWIVLMCYAAWTSGDMGALNVASMILGTAWVVVGIFLCGESWELSPRVRRGLPKTYATRMLWTWWMPGPGTGFMFAISTCLAGLVVLGVAGLLLPGLQSTFTYSVDTPPPVFAMLMAGYVTGYLGLIRLLAMPFLRRFGPSFAAPVAAAVAVLFGGIVVPATIDVVLRGEVSNHYGVLHASNWFWTWDEAFSGSGLPAGIAGLIFAVGLSVLAINAVSLFREFRFRAIAVPPRVRQDLRGDQPAAVDDGK
jgi:ABC-type transport system involved in multi-copper enzyme maturation permease subunit